MRSAASAQPIGNAGQAANVGQVGNVGNVGQVGQVGRQPPLSADPVSPAEPGAELRALVVAYSFPPSGGAGVGRPTKLVKYLGLHRVHPAVLCASNPSSPLRDESLLDDIPAGTELVRVPTLEPGYGLKRVRWSLAGEGRAARVPFGRRALKLVLDVGRQALVPDPQILWLPAAVLALARRLVRGADDVVLISGPPFSQFLLGPLARLRRGTAVILDYRDEWSTVREVYEMNARLPARVGAALERAVIGSAHAITTATEAFRANLLGRFPFLDPDRVVAIPNGYDPDDFPAALPGPTSTADRMTVTYAGTIFRLTSARGFLGAVRRLHLAEPELAKRLRVRFLGRVVDTELDAFAGTEALGVERLGYLPHREAMRALAASHLALCILDEAPHVERIYPAKIFELGHLADRWGLRVLTLSPPGALADLVKAHQIGELLPPRDEAAIAAALVRELRAFVAGGRPPAPRPIDFARFDRRALAGDFARVMRTAVDRARDGSTHFGGRRTGSKTATSSGSA
jgi:glycosyltransferase involved in cell wall biosynthesis